MTRQTSIWLALLGTVSLAAPVYAQDAVSVRTGSHDGYQRIVFDWPSAPNYTVTRSGEKLTLAFTRAGALDAARIAALENVSAARITSGASDNLTLELTLPAQSRLRDVKVGNRIILDVYDPPSGRVAMAPTPKAKPQAEKAQEPPVPAPVLAPAPEAEKKEEAAVETPPVEDAPVEVAVEEANAVTEPVQAPIEEPATEAAAPVAEPVVQEETVATEPEPPAPNVQPHVVTITSSKPAALSVFSRGEWLWIVGSDGLNVPPDLSGPQTELFGLMQRFDVAGGHAYRLKRPEGIGVVAEGGGMRWRLVLSPNPRTVDAVPPQRLSPVAANEETKSARQGAGLLWPLQGPKDVLTFTDPDIGDKIIVVTQSGAGPSARVPYNFVELETLPSYAGLAFLPLAEDVAASLAGDGVRVDRGSADLSLSMGAVSQEPQLQSQSSIDDTSTPAPAPVNEHNLLHLSRWQMGGPAALINNEAILLSEVAAKDEESRVEDMFVLAQLMLANRRGAEALGYLRVAEALDDSVAARADFIGMRGAAYLLAHQPDLAIIDLVSPKLEPYHDIGYWRMKAYADLEDWQRAIQAMPKDVKAINDYPARTRENLSLAVAEVALRAGEVMQAERILADLEPAAGTMPLADKATWQYLMGETARQLKQFEKSKIYWDDLAKSKDDYHRVRAGLALTRLLLERNEITPAQAIDRLEGLRYAWRGDGLEALTNYRLGRVYVENKDYPKGLFVLRDAATLSPDAQLGSEVTSYMTTAFRQLFDSEDLQTVSPLDAIAVYEEFKELLPAGAEGDRIVDQLAERMVDADLLGRAESLFDHQLTNRLKGVEAGRVALRLAAIRLLNNKPDAALKNLDQAEAFYKEGEDQVVPPDTMREITLLRASALAKTGQAERAINTVGTLPPDKIVARLKADIAWKSQRWREAADGLQVLIDVEQIRPDQPLSTEQTDLILNRGIALNLAGDRVGLGTLRERYQGQMAQTPKAELFDVVTLPRRFGLIRSRDTIAETINNVDLFKDFLESYRKADTATP